MIWIRGPAFDGCWLLSGLPIGALAAVLAIWVPYFWIIIVGVLVFDSAHTLSPMVLAWWHPGFRRIILAKKLKFIVFPLALLVAGTAIGHLGDLYWLKPRFDPATLHLGTGSKLHPLYLLGFVYWFWNIYHFGKQNFGVMSIYRLKTSGPAGQRKLDLIFCCLMAWATMAVGSLLAMGDYAELPLQLSSLFMPYALVALVAAAVMLWRERGRLCLPRTVLIVANAAAMGVKPLFPIIDFGVVSVNHWLTAIGLAAQASGHPVRFTLVVLATGPALFCAMFIRGWEIPVDVLGSIIGFRLALGIDHFLYDRWCWRLSDPQVRATIGRDLLREPHLRLAA